MRDETTLATSSGAADPRARLPVAALLALMSAAFITVLTETLPAGVLPAMSADLQVSESAMGQAVTIYAAGSAVAAIPLAAVTASWRRKPLLLTGVAGFTIANTVTALSVSFPLTMVGRFVAGVAAGLVWAILAGYARRLAPAHLEGKAIAIVMAGVPAALSLGVPAGTFLGEALGWRVTFSVMSVLAIVLIGWIVMVVPDRPGERPGRRTPITRAVTIPGVVPVLFVTLAFALGHTVLYTYIATFLGRFGMGGSIDVVLLVFGVASMVSVWIVGAHIDRRLRTLTIASVVLVAVAATLLAVLASAPLVVYVAAAL